jgi:putative ABC transport system permease protein
VTRSRRNSSLRHLGDDSRDVTADVEEELRYHLDRVVDEFVGQGLDRDAAKVRAQRQFGDLDAYRRALMNINQRRAGSMRIREMIDAVTLTIGQSFRGLARSPGFTISVVTILALGLGANAVMFNVVDRLLLRPPAHVVDAERVRLLYSQRRLDDGENFLGLTFTYPDYTDLSDVAAFQAVAAWSGPNEEVLGRGEEARPVQVVAASASLIPLLGTRPALGRGFSAAEAEPGGEGTALVSYEMWERSFAKDPGILGRTLDLSSGTYTVVGVAPRGFTGASLRPVDVWVPLELHQERRTGTTIWRGHRNWWWMQMVVRLTDGVSPDVAGAQATVAHRHGREEMIASGDYDADASLVAAPLIAARGPNPSDESQVARWLAAVSAIVLLIACFNVANLLFARGTQRRREVAVRVALGVSKARLLGELLTQSLLISALGAVGAVGVAQLAGTTIQHVLLPNVAMGSPASSPRLWGFLAIATVLSALLSGVVPATQAGRSDVSGALKVDSGGGRPSSRIRTAMLVTQAMLSVVLLVGAGLFVKSLHHARDLDLGFDARHVIVAEIQWNESLPASERAAIYNTGLEVVRHIPGVRAAGLTYSVPFASTFSIGTPRIPGLEPVPQHPNGGPYANKVSSGYFDAMGLTIVQGRGFVAADDRDDAPPVAVVSQSMARAYWPSGGALGACMLLGDEGDDPPCTTVVGIVEDHRRQELVETDPEWLYFLSQSQPAFRGPPQGIMVGTSSDAMTRVGAVQAELRTVSPQVRFVSARSLQSNIDPQLRSWKLGASLFSAFGMLALAVAAWGLYSVLAFEVALRRRELGIQSALGAGAPRLLRLVLARAVTVVGLGVVLGLVTAGFAARSVGPLLFTVSPWDPEVYLGVAATLVAVACGAGLLPAWKATRVDPKEALQAE